MNSTSNIQPTGVGGEDGAIREYAEQPLCPTNTGLLGVGLLSAVFIVLLSVSMADSIHRVRQDLFSLSLCLSLSIFLVLCLQQAVLLVGD